MCIDCLQQENTRKTIEYKTKKEIIYLELKCYLLLTLLHCCQNCAVKEKLELFVVLLTENGDCHQIVMKAMV